MLLPSLLGHTQELLLTIHNSDKPADSLIDTFFRTHKYLGSHDRRFIAETTYGTLRHLRRCEVVLQQALGEKAKEMKAEDGMLFLILTYLLIIDRRTKLAPNDLLTKIKSPDFKSGLGELLERIPAVDKVHAAEAVQRIGIQYSFPDWMVERFIKQFGEDEAEKLCATLNEQAQLTLRVNTLKTTVELCQARLKSEGVETQRASSVPFGLTVKKRINVFSLEAFRDGLFEVQDEGSQLLPFTIDPKPTAKVLDACAGAGGKTLELAALMKNRGEIVATDINKFRLEELKKRARRAGASNIRILPVNSLEDLQEKYTEFFDIVFVDAPCSGVGTIRRNPGMKWSVTEEMVNELAEKQQSILKFCTPLVKKGGKLVYATCSLFREENEGVIERFTQGNPAFSLAPNSEAWNKFSATGESHYLLPHQSGTDGFFCAVLQKTA